MFFIMKLAVITGVTGQDGSFLTESLLTQGYFVQGWTRNADSSQASVLVNWLKERLPEKTVDHRFQLTEVDPFSVENLTTQLTDFQPHEFYHLAAQSHVGKSYDDPNETMHVNVIGTWTILEAIRKSHLKDGLKFVHASSAEIFGSPTTSPQSELTVPAPVSPYGISKAAAGHLVRMYREVHGIFAANAILYNHESTRRPSSFVTRKITLAAASILLNQQSELVLGNLASGRDWSDARDIVRGLHLIARHETPDDFVLASGQWYSLEQLLSIAFETVHLDWTDYVRSAPAFYRPVDPVQLCGDTTKAHQQLGWQPEIPFEQTLREMVRSDLDFLKSILS